MLAENQDKEDGKEEVVPDPQHIQDDQRQGGGLKQREDHLKENLQARAAVNQGRFLQLFRDGLNKPMIKEYSKGRAEAQVHIDQAPRGVQQVEAAIDPDQRDHDGLKGNEHGGHHAKEHHLVDLPVRAHKEIGRHGGKDRDADHTAHGNHQRVPKRRDKAHALKGSNEVA